MNTKIEPSKEMGKVLDLLVSGKTDGVSELLKDVRRMSALQAWMLASFFDNSWLAATQNPYRLKISRRKKGAPSHEAESKQERAYRLGKQVAKERAKLKDADVKTSLTKAINKVIKDCSVVPQLKAPSPSTLKRDLYYFEKVEELRTKLKMKGMFPPWPPLGKSQSKDGRIAIVAATVLRCRSHPMQCAGGCTQRQQQRQGGISAASAVKNFLV